MNLDDIEQELSALEYAIDKMELIINELEDEHYWKGDIGRFQDDLDVMNARKCELEEMQNNLWKEGY